MSFSFCSDDRMQFSSSQPDFAAGGWEAMLLISQNDGQVSFSQPTKPEHMLLGSQLLATPGASQVIHILSARLVSLRKCLYVYLFSLKHTKTQIILFFFFLFFLPFTKVSFDLKASEYQQNSDALLL